MKDNNTPATKADIQKLLKEFTKVNGRIDSLDQRIDGLDQRMDRFENRMDDLGQRMVQFENRMDGLDQKIDAFREETAKKLDEIHRECGILVENSHLDLGGATGDLHQILREKNIALEGRVARLEDTVGLTAA